jgi:hypothetical protein
MQTHTWQKLSKGKIMAKPQQTATELSRTLSGQWTKTEKRAAISRSIMAANKRTHEIMKKFKQESFLSK